MSIETQALKFILTAFEQNGTQMTPEFARLLKIAFSFVDPGTLMQATVEAMKSAKGRLTIAEIQKHVDLLAPRTPDKHSSAEEAWALIPKNEQETAYLTEEMRDAMNRGGIADFLERSDFIGAERAFKKLYDENVAKSRATGRKPIWHIELGHDSSMRVLGLEKAVSRGIVKADTAINYDPQNEAIYLSAERNYIEKLADGERKQLAGRLLFLTGEINKLADNIGNKPVYEYEPTEAELNDPYTQSQAAILGLSVWEYKVIPAPAKIAAKVHAQLSKQYGINLEKMTMRKGS